MKRGFSYVEVMLSGVALSIFLIPVIATFYQAMNSQRFAMIYYQGALNAKSILLKLSNVMDDRFEQLDYYFEIITREYNTDIYSYTLHISKLNPNEPLYLYRYFYTDPSHVKENIFDYFSHTMPSVLPHSNVQLLDMNYPVEIPGVIIESNTIYFSRYIGEDFSISILNIPRENEFHIHNFSDHQVFVTILDSYRSDLNNVHLHTKSKSIVLTYLAPVVNYFVVLRVYSVEAEMLIKSLERIL